MAHYRKIETCIWNDQKFNGLSPDGKLIFLFLLTHPNLTILGAMRLSSMGIAGELQLSFERVEGALSELMDRHMVHYEAKALCLWLPQFLKYNPPESPNVVKSWENAVNYLPEGELKKTLMCHARDVVLQLGSAFQAALPEIFCQGTLSNEMNPLSCCAPVTRNQTLTTTPTITLPQTPTETPVITPTVTPPQPPTETPPLTTEQRAVSIKHKAMSIKPEEINQENNANKKNNRGEIKTIVAPARPKKYKPPDGEVVEVFRYWQHTLGHPQAQLDTNRRQCIGKALASGYSVAQLCEAIRGCSLTPHNLGDNDQGQRYDGLHVILRHADQIDRFIRNARSPPRRLTAADRLWADNEAAGDRWMALQQENEEKEVFYADETTPRLQTTADEY